MGKRESNRVWSTCVRLGVILVVPFLLMVTASADYGPAEQARIDALQRAADMGSVPDQSVLGNMYLHGTGVPKDHEKALLWSGKAARQGGALAQHDLGYMYYRGIGVPRDYARAAYWHRKAAEQGFGPSQLGMGVMYALGQGVPQDYVLAHKWSDLAATHMAHSVRVVGADPNRREAAVRYRDAVAVHMTPEQIAEAQRRAREWQPKVTP
jgi:uncharacterized protein